MKEEKIIEILKSGDFTVIYWDSGVATLYQKKWNYHEEQERDDYETLNKFVILETSHTDGYCPEIVALLVKALGGKSDSI